MSPNFFFNLCVPKSFWRSYLTLPPRYSVTLLLCYPVTVTLLLCYPVTFLRRDLNTLLPCYCYRYLPSMLLCYLLISLPCYSYLATLLLCYLVNLLPCYSVTLLLCCLVTLLACYPLLYYNERVQSH